MIEISSSLNPSNTLAEQANGGTIVFPNLARQIANRGEAYPYHDVLFENAQQILEETDRAIIDELVAAGFPRKMARVSGRAECGPFQLYHEVEDIRMKNGCFPEVPTTVIGLYNMWRFERRWYYYAADGPGIPPEIAEEFHQTWGRQVRVEGHCGCPSPLEYCSGFAVDSYHIDTPEGLKAFVQLLGKVYRPYKKESA